ncbi:hypothetical protein GCM10011349_14000 [Novosphingobium indicum]|uniref:Uncharacterized protein n=1 Tax=Novosphingobium indicum TaxID=462949 RepID=A0ABQ2JJT5_9SPHN|nr:hypothetical protein GCM10011349_14000 [Novosphingobium indicum]
MSGFAVGVQTLQSSACALREEDGAAGAWGADLPGHAIENRARSGYPCGDKEDPPWTMIATDSMDIRSIPDRVISTM